MIVLVDNPIESGPLFPAVETQTSNTRMKDSAVLFAESTQKKKKEMRVIRHVLANIHSWASTNALAFSLSLIMVS